MMKHANTSSSNPVEIGQRLSLLQHERARLAHEEKQIEAELNSLNELQAGGKRRLPMAKMLVASPCDESWAKMTGDDKSRFCNSCQKNVHNLSAMTSLEVEEFLLEHSGGDVCIRLYERRDGTVLTSDCPEGIKRRRARSLLLASLGAGACGLFAFTAVAVTLAALNRPPKVVVLPGPTQTQYISSPPPPPVVNTVYVPKEIPLPTAASGKGWVLVHAPEGTKIFEGNRLLGTGGMVVTMSEGAHTLRAEGPSTAWRDAAWKESRDVSVTNANRSEVHFGPPIVRHVTAGVKRPTSPINDPF